MAQSSTAAFCAAQGLCVSTAIRSSAHRSSFGCGHGDDAGVPNTVQVAAPVEEPHLELVTALVVVLAHVHRHVEVFDQVHEEPEGKNSRSSTVFRAVLEDHLQLADLGGPGSRLLL